MKPIFLITLYFSIYSNIFGQCPTPGIKIQTPLCEGPKILVATSISCSETQVKWIGNKSQQYILKATYTDPATKTQLEAKTSQIASDQNNTFTASVYSKEGVNVSWSVQAVCSIENAMLYSAEVNGVDFQIPYCQKATEIVTTKMRVYPNPTTGYLMVEYPDKIEGNIEFMVLDAAGKMVFQQRENGTTQNRYTLDLRRLLNGLYLLEMYNGKTVNQVKFELFRN